VARKAHEQLRAANERKEVSTTLAKPDVLDAVWIALHRWADAPLDSDPRVPELRNYGARVLATRRGRARTAFLPEHAFFAAVDAFVDAQEAARVAAVHEAVGFARRRLAELKRERELIGFDDLIRELAQALEGAQGARRWRRCCSSSIAWRWWTNSRTPIRASGRSSGACSPRRHRARRHSRCARYS
jgi:ATP-dependent exoDNAse (exonuclease V) beta subunit